MKQLIQMHWKFGFQKNIDANEGSVTTLRVYVTGSPRPDLDTQIFFFKVFFNIMQTFYAIEYWKSYFLI